MNAKKAKKLRRIARQMNAGGDERHYQAIRRKHIVTALDKYGRKHEAELVTQQVILNNCERATYNQLKRMVG